MCMELDLLNPHIDLCTFPSCDRKRARSSGLCGGHDKQRSRKEDLHPLANPGLRPTRTPVEDFWAKVNKNGPVPKHDPELGPCWIWTGTIKKNGYGDWMLWGRHVYPHRFAWALENGCIPHRGIIDHRCWNRRCARPSHIRLTDKSGNGHNRAGLASSNKTGYRNVESSHNGRTFCVRLKVNGKRIYIGSYPSAEEANTAAIAARREHYPQSQW